MDYAAAIWTNGRVLIMPSHSLVDIRSIDPLALGRPPLARALEPPPAATMENAASRFGQHLAHTGTLLIAPFALRAPLCSHHNDHFLLKY